MIFDLIMRLHEGYLILIDATNFKLLFSSCKHGILCRAPACKLSDSFSVYNPWNTSISY